ncbi:GTP-binding protein [Clostridium sp. YIM B02515]|uniref:GTP-binding protein n=1 Tax=Clostridium rhizosphaerae TaxID=2803861 RepID=A0ABS1T7S2_9CLOT|nr:GTP-binding protein [Clostridium rhizosphaerae]MBL4934399.1 GTP-binding protein [Clostridium rhizosphaerae]
MIKVDIVSGFLGAGKTTLIKKLLTAYKDEKVVLIENEFGDIGIDGDIVEKDGFDVVEITSGCICCIMKKDFVTLFEKVLCEYKPERVIIEPTGISILSEIIEVLKLEQFKNICEINSIITVIDGISYMEQRDVFGEFFEDQIINAGTLMISKSQLADSELIDKIIASLRELNLKAPIITDNWSKLTQEEIKSLLDLDLNIDFDNLFYTEYKPCSDNQFDALAIKTSKKFNEESLAEALNRLKESEFGMVIRAKGFLKGKGFGLEFSYANGYFEIYKSKFDSTGKLCIIGKNLEDKKIKELFQTKIGGLFKW